jgi:hypothetical protein
MARVTLRVTLYPGNLPVAGGRYFTFWDLRKFTASCACTSALRTRLSK